MGIYKNEQFFRSNRVVFTSLIRHQTLSDNTKVEVIFLINEMRGEINGYYSYGTLSICVLQVR